MGISKPEKFVYGCVCFLVCTYLALATGFFSVNQHYDPAYSEYNIFALPRDEQSQSHKVISEFPSYKKTSITPIGGRFKFQGIPMALGNFDTKDSMHNVLDYYHKVLKRRYDFVTDRRSENFGFVGTIDRHSNLSFSVLAMQDASSDITTVFPSAIDISKKPSKRTVNDLPLSRHCVFMESEEPKPKVNLYIDTMQCPLSKARQHYSIRMARLGWTQVPRHNEAQPDFVGPGGLLVFRKSDRECTLMLMPSGQEKGKETLSFFVVSES